MTFHPAPWCSTWPAPASPKPTNSAWQPPADRRPDPVCAATLKVANSSPSCAANQKRPPDDLLIAVDHEGGRVQRFKTDGFTHLPPMRALGRLWDADDAPKGAKAWPWQWRQQRRTMLRHQRGHACGYVLGAELRMSLRCRPELCPRARPGPRPQRRHRRPRLLTATRAWWHLLAKSLMHGLLHQRHGQLRQALSGPRLCARRLAFGHSGGRPPVANHFGRRCHAVSQWLSSSLASVMPAHVIYSQGRLTPGGFFQPSGCRTSCGPNGFSGPGVQ
jgi:beta-N-acetylhexosaminidase